MVDDVKAETVRYLFHVQLNKVEPPKPSATPISAPNRTVSVGAAGKVGRNDPCPCGSGKKYKRCHGA